jgi:hypothetical protein
LSARFEFQGENSAGVVVTCYGNLASEDLFAANLEIFARVEAADLRYYLIDLSDVDSLGISAEKLLLLAQRDRTLLQGNPELRMAFVTNHEVVESVVRLWLGYIDQGKQSVQQFTDMQAARTWVGQMPQRQLA